jgi:hypothetical protein
MSRSSLLALALSSACSDYGVNIIELPEVAPPDSEPPFEDTQWVDTQPPVDTEPPPACGEGPWPEGEAAVDERCIWEPETRTFRPVVEWWIDGFEEHPEFVHSVVTPVVGQVTDDDGDGDVDEDDVPDIALTFYTETSTRHEGVLRLVSGDGSRVHWSMKEQEWEGVTWQPIFIAGVSLAEVDGDGVPELATTLTDGVSPRMAMVNADGTIRWVNTDVVLYDGNNAPAFADLEGDGVVEIVCGRNIFDAATGALRASGLYGSGSYTTYANSGYHSFPIDLDGDGQQEIVAGNSLYDLDGNTLCITGYADGYSAVADLDGDGEPDIVTTGNGWVRVFGSDCWIDEQWELIDGGYGGPPTIADYDGDGEPEIGVASYGVYYVFEADGTLLWSELVQDHSSSSTGSSVFDFEADGYAEVVYADEEDLWIYQGSTGDVRLRDSTHVSQTVNEYPTIIDVDGDGEVEIVVADYEGLFVVGDYDHSWVAGRQVWNQASYNIVNVNDDLTIPAVPEPNWPDHNNFRSGDVTRAFASASPDPLPLLVDLCSLECEQGVLQLTVQVGNGGLGVISGPLAVAVYGDGVLLDSVTTVADIPSGGASEAITFRLEVAGLALEALTVVVNDGGAMPECHEDNNTLVIREGLCP